MPLVQHQGQDYLDATTNCTVKYTTVDFSSKDQLTIPKDCCYESYYLEANVDWFLKDFAIKPLG